MDRHALLTAIGNRWNTLFSPLHLVGVCFLMSVSVAKGTLDAVWHPEKPGSLVAVYHIIYKVEIGITLW